MHIDDLGIICQPQRDGTLEGGDSVNWMGHALFVGALRGWSIERYCSTFEVRPGVWVRHPIPSRSMWGWASYEDGVWNGCVSRDQMTGILCCLLKFDHRDALKSLFVEHCKRFLLFATNTIKNGQDPKTITRKCPDLTGPDVWALYVRGLMRPSLIKELLLCVLDLHLLAAAIMFRRSPRTDVLSFVIKLAAADLVDSSPVSRYALSITSRESVIDSLREYWCGWRDQPEMFYYWEAYARRELWP